MTDKLKIMTWLWAQKDGRATYTANHVNIWAAMLKRHLTIPFSLACVTDMPDGIDPDIEIIKPPGDFVGLETPTWNKDKPNCFRRLSLFSPKAEKLFKAKRFVSMDLDCVICKNIDDLFTRSEDLVLYRGTSFDRPYNGSMVLMTAGCRPQVYKDFNEKNAILSGAKYVGSDQAWLAYKLGPGEAVWDFNDGVYWYGSKYNSSQSHCKIVFFPGSPKPQDLCLTGIDKFIKLWYKGDRKDAICLILGYNKDVWDEVKRSLDKGPFEAIIASPETADYLPNVDFIAANDEQAMDIAYMLGYKNYIFCGRSDED